MKNKKYFASKIGERIQNYIWLILKILISGLLIYLVVLDVWLILGYTELEKLISIERNELLQFRSELGLFGFGLFVFDGITLLFGKIFSFFLPLVIMFVNLILIISILVAMLIFKQKGKILVIFLIILIFIYYLLGVNEY